MRIIASVFSSAKEGSRAEENDDACWPPGDGELRTWRYRVAISDGATESAFAGSWSRQLVRAFARGKLNPPYRPSDFAPIQASWYEAVGKRDLPWYAAEKAKSGAFATLLGIELWTSQRRSAAPGRWKAWAIGDSCVAHVRGDQLKTCFPISDSRQFNSRPFLISSNARSNATAEARFQSTEGVWKSDDLFLLMTDALASWFVSSVEHGERPWAILRDLGTDGSAQPWDEFIASLRRMNTMKNDDTTLLRVDVV